MEQELDFDQDWIDAFEEKDFEAKDEQESGKSAPADTEDKQPDSEEDSSTESESPEKSRPEEASTNKDKEEPETDNLATQYEQALSQLKLANSRLENLSSQYQATKGELKTLRETSTKQKEIPLQFVEPEAFKTLKEDWPDVAEAVEAYIKSNIEQTRKSVEELVSSKVEPIERNLNDSAANTHWKSIQQAHPDVFSIVETGELDAWQASLSPVAQRGVQAIRDTGSTEEVIKLLDEYKASKENTKTQPKPKSSTSSKPEGKEVQAVGFDYDTLLEKLKAASFVPSAKSTPKTGASLTQADPDDFDAAFAEATKND